MAVEQNKQNENKDAATGVSKAAGNSGGGGQTNTASTGASAKTAQGEKSGSSGGSSQQPAKDSNQEKDSTNQLSSAVSDALQGNTSAAKSILSQAKESTGKVAGEAFGQVKEKAVTKIDEQKSNLAQGLGSVAQTIRQVGESIKDAQGENSVASATAQYGDSLAKQVEQFSGYLEKHNVSELMRDVERFARRNPAYFIGGAFVLGLLGARFLKSSNPGGDNSENQPR